MFMLLTARLLILGAALTLLSSEIYAQRGAPPPLPFGAGRELVMNVCSSCHSTTLISRAAGYNTAAEWRRVFSTMVELNDAQAGTIAAYLAQHFPEDTSRRPNLIAGDTQIEIFDWTVPTLGQRSRDPVEASDGSIWWAGMWASLARAA